MKIHFQQNLESFHSSWLCFCQLVLSVCKYTASMLSFRALKKKIIVLKVKFGKSERLLPTKTCVKPVQLSSLHLTFNCWGFQVRCLPLPYSVRETIGQSMLQARVKVLTTTIVTVSTIFKRFDWRKLPGIALILLYYFQELVQKCRAAPSRNQMMNQNSFQLIAESNLCFLWCCCTSLFDWSKNTRATFSANQIKN